MEGALHLSTDPGRVQVETVRRWLAEEAYWSLGRSLDDVRRSLAGSRVYGVYAVEGAVEGAYRQDVGDEDGGSQVAFARAVTDGVTFAWLCDVFVAPERRGQGIGRWLVESAVRDLREQGVPRILLRTRDAHSLYRGLGFGPLTELDRWMEWTSG